MSITINNITKSAASITNVTKDQALTWDEATYTWDSATGTWDVPGTRVTNISKVNVTISNESKL